MVDIENYTGKGCVSTFIKDYGEELYKYILNKTKKLNDTCNANKKLPARLLFKNIRVILIKFINNKPLIFKNTRYLKL